MTAATLSRCATVIAFFGVYVYAAAAVGHTPQDSLVASALSKTAVAGHRQERAEPAQRSGASGLDYSTGIAAPVMDAYGLGALEVPSFGSFIFSRWQAGLWPPSSSGRSANSNQSSSPNSRHVLFAWPAT